MYFIKKGYKNFIYIPLISIVVIAISMYSPIMNIRYYKEGALLISYKGDRILVSSKKGVDMERLSKISNASESYKIEKNIYFKDMLTLKTIKNDYILKFKDKEFILNMSGKENYYNDYDIISFKDGPVNRIFIIGDKLIGVCS